MAPRSITTLVFLGCWLVLGMNQATAREKQIVMGAGPSTAVVTLFFTLFAQEKAAQGYDFEVDQRSIKHAGGIKASSTYLFGRTGRPLNKKELQLSKQEIPLARIPLTMVVGRSAGVERISLNALELVLQRKTTNWKELGGTDHKILLIGRENSEAAYSILKRRYPFFRDLQFDHVLSRDHQVVNMIESVAGAYAIAFGAKSNFDPSRLLQVTDLRAGVNLGLVYDLNHSNHPIVAAVQQFRKSELWLQTLAQHDFLPPLTD